MFFRQNRVLVGFAMVMLWFSTTPATAQINSFFSRQDDVAPTTEPYGDLVPRPMPQQQPAPRLRPAPRLEQPPRPLMNSNPMPGAIEFEPPGTIYEMPSRVNSGTLFQWSRNPMAMGPDRNGPLITDRPDFTEASSTVGCGVLQLEMGYTYTFDNDGTTQTKTDSFPEPLLRYGLLADWLELRLGWNYFQQETNATRREGADDLYFGFKLGLTPQDGILPEMALIPQMTIPTGASAFTTNEVLPGLNWLYSWELTDRLSTGGSTQINRALDETTLDNYHQWAQSWTVAYALTQKWGVYNEWFAFFPENADTAKPEHYYNGGFTRLIGDNIQWDIRAGLGLNDEADDYFLGTGLTFRFK